MKYEEFIAEYHNPEVGYITAHTSGSTGTPKEILLDKRLVDSSALRSIKFFGIDANSHIHSSISPDFIGGKMAVVRALLANCRFSYEEPSNRPIILTDSKWPDLISVVPSQMLFILENFSDIPAYVKFLVGGSPVNRALATRIEAAGISAWESYGMTETASHIALRRISADPEPFTPLEGISVDSDSRGCLTIELPYSEKIITNDLVAFESLKTSQNSQTSHDSQTSHNSQIPDKRFQILGRIDNVLITGGKKVIPEEVEATLFPRLKELGASAILLTGREDEKWGQRLMLMIEVNATDVKILENSERGRIIIREAEQLARELLPGYKRPKEIRLTDVLPRTPNGKLIRNTTFAS